MFKFYEELSPTQKIIVRTIAYTAYACLVVTVLGKAQRQRAFMQGYKAGCSPAKQDELTACYEAGQRRGYTDGAWARNGEVFQRGIELGSEITRTALETQQAINVARTSAATAHNITQPA